jgi:hypothetical protein
VDHYITDEVLHRIWAVLVDCAHPDRPWIAAEVPLQKVPPTALGESVKPIRAVSLKPAPLVSAGAKVELWKSTDSARIRLTGIALQAGDMGERIRVRITQGKGAVVEGRVRGEHSVEIAAPAKWSAQ